MEWLRFNDRLAIDMSILWDRLSAMMLVVVGVVAVAVTVYSLGYMRGERGRGRYFLYLSLFIASMLGLVVSTNVFQMYVFWELVGASSYLLIGFYYTRPAAVAAARKAFIVTRFADLGFLIGILLLSGYTGTFDFGLLTANSAGLVVGSMGGKAFLGLPVAVWAMGLIFMGAAGKSAMFPMHVWLPDAMEGPTPVSALIHAATMVVAGVYLVARMFPVFVFAAPEVLVLMTYVGAFTALFAAVIAVAQTDIKRVLAFSTISQIAYMMVALGVARADVTGVAGYSAGYDAGLFHLFTHAFFKALLFLGAGSVIHAVHSNEMGSMGGLGRRMPLTNATFLVACLAISGIPPLSGFFSKDAILGAVWAADKFVFGVLLATAGITAFYMFRLYFRIFAGAMPDYKAIPHESPATMTVPMVVLAAITCVAGFVPMFFGRGLHVEWGVAGASVVVAVIGIFMAWRLRGWDGRSAFWRAAGARFRVDDLWLFFARTVVFRYISRPVAWFDRRVVDGAVNAVGTRTVRAADAIRPLQSGKVQTYAVVYVAAVLAITLIVFVLC